MGRISRNIAPVHPAGTKYSDINVSVLILAGAIGYRMKSYGPKSMLTIGEKTVLDYQVESIKRVYPKSEIVIVIGFGAEKIVKNKPNGVRLVENQLYENTGELTQLRLGLNNITENNIIIINGDILFNDKAISIVSSKSSLLIDQQNKLPESEIGAVVSENMVTNLSHGLDKNWCNICFVTGKELQHLRRFVNNRDKEKLFFFEAINYLIERNGKFSALSPDKMSVYRINSIEDMSRINENFNI